MRVHRARVCPNFLSGELDCSSAKYGFLWPTDLVEGQYNVSFSRRCDSVIRDVDLRDQVTRLCLSQFSEIVVIAATAYAAAVHRRSPIGQLDSVSARRVASIWVP